MDFDLEAATNFVGTHGRLLDWRRLRHLLGDGAPEHVLLALDGYHNPDGGYGWALEPDLRSVTSQPVAAMHALEVLAELRDTGDRAPRLLDWLAGQALADGSVPFARAYPDTAGSAPHWAGADPAAPSLMMTAQLAAQAHRLAPHHPGVAGHPWLAAATSYGLAAIERIDEPPFAIELMFLLRFLDAIDSPLTGRLAGYANSDGPTRVAGGAEGEVLHLLDFTPHPGTRSRSSFDADAVAADRERLAGLQQPDGGWPITFAAFSPAAALEWRGYATVQAVSVLLDAPL
ncbi:hypothetical protein [Actinoplanes sp. NPDC049265]|uniref:hypothetical protein n=1 Tax=Actinoplanes sp. NPDC049265 TaxID=3363902 RepID=UPI00371D847D